MSDLELIKQKWIELGIVEHFPYVHHYFSTKFATEEPSSLDVFYDSIKGKNIYKENAQTVRRALAAANYRELKYTVAAAIKKAWVNYPIVNR
ncbi:MAG: hypothetical protein GDA55_01075 [Cellvibrionales bacterium]|nr:hypothetical protein [Cellvibrionales bacterium]